MDYAGRFSVEMEYNADYDRMLQILEAGISKLESNQTGSIRLDLNPPILTLDWRVADLAEDCRDRGTDRRPSFFRTKI